MNTNSQLNKPTTKTRRTGFLRDERGAGMVEYLLLAGLVALGAFTAFGELGDKIGSKAGDIGGKLDEID